MAYLFASCALAGAAISVCVKPAVAFMPIPQAPRLVPAPRSTFGIMLNALDDTELATMRMKQIKAELLERQIDFSDCFDKESLADKLIQARTAANSSGTPRKPRPSHTAPSAPSSAAHPNMEPGMMRVKQIKTELRERKIDFSDCVDKESLADRLVQARAGRVSAPPSPPAPSPPPVPPPAPASSRKRHSHHTASAVRGDTAANSKRNQRGSPVDAERQGRSPGIMNNFYDKPLDDFKRPHGAASTARTGPSPARTGPPPAPPPARSSTQGDDISMEDAFRAAGWTGQQQTPIDTARSPSMKRNFRDMPQSDFKKPYTRTGAAPTPPPARTKRSPAPPAPSSAAPSPATSVKMSPQVQALLNTEPGMMKAKQIKAELKERKIDFSDCIDKESLADKLVQARGLVRGSPPPPQSPPAPPPPPARTRTPPAPPAPSSAAPSPVTSVEMSPKVRALLNREPRLMRVKQITAELKERKIDFSDCIDKESLADKLVRARAGLVSAPASPPPSPPPPPVPPPPPASSRERHTHHTASAVPGDAAPNSKRNQRETPVNAERQGRSPGIANNFYDKHVSDFKRPHGAASTPPPARTGTPPPPSPSPAADPSTQDASSRQRHPYHTSSASPTNAARHSREANHPRHTATAVPGDTVANFRRHQSEPPIDAERQGRSPGIANNFYDKHVSDFRRPHGAASTARTAPPTAPPHARRSRQGEDTAMEDDFRAAGWTRPPPARTGTPPAPWSRHQTAAPPDTAAHTRRHQRGLPIERQSRSRAIANNFFKRPHAASAPPPARAGPPPVHPPPTPHWRQGERPPPAPRWRQGERPPPAHPPTEPPWRQGEWQPQAHPPPQPAWRQDEGPPPAHPRQAPRWRQDDGLSPAHPPSTPHRRQNEAPSPAHPPPAPYSRQGEDMSMEDAFRAAGWTGEQQTPIDTDRSPGMNRNFRDMDQSDFKKPYTRRN